MLSPKNKRNIARVLPYGVLWFIFGLIYCIVEKSLLGNMDHYPATGVHYDFSSNVIVIPIAGLMMGLMTGVLEIRYFNNWFIKKSFARKIIVKSFIYLVIVIAFLIIITIINMLYNEDKRSLTDLSSPSWAFFTDYGLMGVVLYMASIVVIAQFYAEFSDSIGQGTLHNFFMGKYHHPIVEERIFMFLDMKSSTTIAEKLGHVMYFEMLKEYFFDLSEAVIDCGGTIYQYAGDEMIVCWTLKDGIRKNNSIECFFAMKRTLEMQEKKYNSKYGFTPGFKAGMHYGTVAAGEIGSLKKEIIFTGDVLNTTARIQGLCNQFGVDLLLSEDLFKILHLPPIYTIRALGENILKGRSKPMELFSVSIQTE
ncbi:MAG: adenylate/guanylate cyclase domain-containing protein [Flavobacterium psychrophilum]|nr:MAG: adenylate/guanylate cyclase domain-containing protein [Flavobacterium psychrophilum]